VKNASILLLSLGILVSMAGPAAAKGPIPTVATITGPGLVEPIAFKNNFGPRGTNPSGDAARVSLLAEQTRLYDALFEVEGTSASAPTGDLGPHYTITWKLEMVGIEGLEPEWLKSDLYPYAEGGPVAFTAPAKVDFGDKSPVGTWRIEGGWKNAPPVLVENLQAWGVPSLEELVPPIAVDEAAGRGTAANEAAATWQFPWLPVAAIALGLGAPALYLTRRRPMWNPSSGGARL
jgi:hypothetical protein